MLDTLLGGFLAILGGWGAIWFQLRNTRKNRMSEIIAERKVTTNAQAYAYAKEIEAALLQRSSLDTLKIILSHEEWFFNSRLFLPGKFPAKWLSIRNNIQKLARWEGDGTKALEEKISLEEHLKKSVADAIDEIYKDMDLERIVLD